MSNPTLSLVLDIGESNIRMGYAGDAQPRLSLPTTFAKKIQSQASLNESFGEIKEGLGLGHIKQIPGKSSLLFGDVLLTDKPFYEYKKIFDVQENGKKSKEFKIFTEMYVDELCPGMSLDPKSYPLMVIEPSKNDKEFRESVMSMVIKSGIPRIYLVKKAAANLYACGRSNGIVIEAGGKSTRVTPIQDGYLLQKCHSYSNFGGDEISLDIAKSLENDAQFLPDGLVMESEKGDYHPSCFEYFKFLKAEEIKKKLLNLGDDEE